MSCHIASGLRLCVQLVVQSHQSSLKPVESFVYFAAGCIVSWGITAFYYRRSSVRAPEWAREFVQKLPERPIGQEEFARLFSESIKDVTIDGGAF